jgi:hypothetical protein
VVGRSVGPRGGRLRPNQNRVCNLGCQNGGVARQN